MFRNGGPVYHEEYGWGRFSGIIGKQPRMAKVHFQGRGVRFFVLPSMTLLAGRQLRQRRPQPLQ